MLQLLVACSGFLLPERTFAFQIFVRPVSGGTITLEVEPSTTVVEVKQMIQDRTGIPVERQCLFFSGQELPNGATLLDFNVQKESTLFLQECQQIENAAVPALSDAAWVWLVCALLFFGTASLRRRADCG